MRYVAAALKILTAIPDVLKALKALIGWLEVQFGPDWPQRLADLQSASAKWSSAQTTKEREDAAKALAAALNSRK